MPPSLTSFSAFSYWWCIISTGVFFLRLMGPTASSVTGGTGGGKGENVVEPSVGTGSSAGCNSSTGTGSFAGSFSESPVIWDTAMFGSLERRLIYTRTMFNVHKKYEYNASEINEYQDYIYVSSKKASLSDARPFDLWRTSQYNGVLLSNAIKNLNLNTF